MNSLLYMYSIRVTLYKSPCIDVLSDVSSILKAGVCQQPFIPSVFDTLAFKFIEILYSRRFYFPISHCLSCYDNMIDVRNKICPFPIAFFHSAVFCSFVLFV